jgi:predicted nucleic acid-binding Zn finger protein
MGVVIMNKLYLVKGKYIIDLNFPFTCSCPNFKLVHEYNGTFCKHIKELLKRLENAKK